LEKDLYAILWEKKIEYYTSIAKIETKINPYL
jgi:hypothetical protein